MGLGHGASVVTNGLVLNLDAANVKSYPGSGTAWSDLSGRGNNGTLTNGPTFSSGNGGSIVFDGVNDRFGTNSQIDLSNTSAISVDFWCKVLSYTEVAGAWAIVFEVSANFNGSTTGLYVGIAEDSSITWRGSGVQYPISLNIRGNVGYNLHGFDKTLVNDLQWHHWVCIFDKSVSGTNPIESRLFIDSIERSVSVFSSNRLNNTNNFGNDFWYIGSRSNGAAPSNVSITGFKVYDRILTSAEIQQNFNAFRGRYGI